MAAPDAQDAAPLPALRDDLRRGEFGSLDRHLAAMERLAGRIEAGALDPAALPRLRAEADACRDILGAAAAGVRAALRRLGEAGAPTAVYSSDGTRRPLGGARPGPGSRA